MISAFNIFKKSEKERAAMNLQIIQPSPLLAPYVKNYWAMEGYQPPGHCHIQRIVPNGFAEMTIYFDDLPVYKPDAQKLKSNLLLSGLTDGFYDILVTGKLQMLSVVFKPQGTKLFFGIPVSEFTNQNVPAEYIFKNRAKELIDLLSGTHGIKQKVSIIEKFLISLLVKHNEYGLARITCAIQLINTRKGILRLEELASKTCLSKKQFERSFTDYVGITPKKFLRIVRFQNSLYTLQTKAARDMTSLAYECGYYDQSHLIYEFKLLTGLTPVQFVAECEPYSDYFSL